LIANAEQDYEPYRWESMAKRYQDLLTSLATKGKFKSEHIATTIG
jgi:hypothetical protein